MMQNYVCEGQLELTDLLKSKVADRKVMDLTNWINSQGKAQYMQIRDVIVKSYEMYKDDTDIVERIVNNVSVYVLRQSLGYMEYLEKVSNPFGKE